MTRIIMYSVAAILFAGIFISCAFAAPIEQVGDTTLIHWTEVPGLVGWLPWIGMGAAMIVAAIPKPPPGTAMAAIWPVLNLLAINLGHAANAVDKANQPQDQSNAQAGHVRGQALVLLILAGLVMIGMTGCGTTPQQAKATQNIVTAACIASSLAPAAMQSAGALAVIVDPAQADNVALAQKAQQAAHPIVQAACAQALAGSMPVDGTVTVTAVPAPPVK
jgi:hypothetical protein